MKPSTHRKNQLQKVLTATEVNAITRKELLKDADKLRIPNAAGLDTKSLAREIALAKLRKENRQHAAR